jgi:hypothetical protein
VLEPQFRPEFVEEIEDTLKKDRFVKVKDFAEEYILNRKPADRTNRKIKAP